MSIKSRALIRVRPYQKLIRHHNLRGARPGMFESAYMPESESPEGARPGMSEYVDMSESESREGGEVRHV